MTSPSKPIICLAHGAWHYPLYYRKLIDPLRAQGYTVLAPTNATVGIDDSIAGKTYVDDVKRIHEVLLPHLDAGKVAVMVCHSYGGIPGTAALEGQTVEERAEKGLKGGKAIFQDFDVWHRQEGEIRMVNPQAGEIFYIDSRQDERKKHMAELLYQSHASFVTGPDYAATEVKIPKTYAVCTEDKCIAAPGQHAMACAMGARVIEFACGHSQGLRNVESKNLVKLIAEIAG